MEGGRGLFDQQLKKNVAFDYFALASVIRLIHRNSGTERNWAATEKAINDGRERSYNIPIRALPRNQKMPKPVLKSP
jgi:hypothetical protein